MALIWQTPTPSQILPLTLLPTQIVAPQLVPAGALEQAAAVPWQAAMVPHGLVAWTTHWPPGFEPCLATPQMPSPEPDCLFAAAHARHTPEHAVSQQTPSAQKPVLHWALLVHVAPCGSLDTHALAEQKSPAMQSALDEQLVGHVTSVPSQR
jgi:hypothetical protein